MTNRLVLFCFMLLMPVFGQSATATSGGNNVSSGSSFFRHEPFPKNASPEIFPPKNKTGFAQKWLAKRFFKKMGLAGKPHELQRGWQVALTVLLVLVALGLQFFALFGFLGLWNSFGILKAILGYSAGLSLLAVGVAFVLGGIFPDLAFRQCLWLGVLIGVLPSLLFILVLASL